MIAQIILHAETDAASILAPLTNHVLQMLTVQLPITKLFVFAPTVISAIRVRIAVSH